MSLAMVASKPSNTAPSSRPGGLVSASSGARSPSRRSWLALLALGLLVVLFHSPISRHVRAAALLARFEDTKAAQPVLDESLVSVPAPRGPVRARLFRPPGRPDAPGVVLVHGVHYKGIDEPRLLRFARSIADAGVTVLAPEIAELADYHVDRRSIETVGASMAFLAGQTGHEKVGVMGMSFGGGIALLTAADPRFVSRAGFVVAVGAHDDLPRILRFFATDEILDSTGKIRPWKAHGYGATVLVYNEVSDFFPEEDVPAARDALRAWLREDREGARAIGARMKPASREKLEKIFAPDITPMRGELLSVLARHGGEDAGVSPRGHLAGLAAPVYLLHGAGDTIIPSTETEWLAKDVPRGTLRQVLVSRALAHVELEGEPGSMEKWALVHFMGQVLAEAEEMP